MSIVSPFLKKVLYPSLYRFGAFRRGSFPGLVVVTYHGVLPQGYDPVDRAFDGNLVSSEMLEQQLRLLKAHYNLISPEDVLAWRQGQSGLPPRAVLVTCDDGLLNCLTDMLPILQQQEVRCLFFVTGASSEESRTMLWYEELYLLFLRAPSGQFEISGAGIVISGDLQGRPERRAAWWNSVKRLSQIDADNRASFLRSARMYFRLDGEKNFNDTNPAACRRFGLMTRSELQQLAAAGMTIGAHTNSHPMLSQMPPESAFKEISESRTKLETVVKTPVWAFAYPFGNPESVTAQVLDMPPRAGFDAAFLNYGGGLGTDLPAYALPRIHITSNMNLAEFEAHVSGFYERLQRLAGRNSQAIGLPPA